MAKAAADINWSYIGDAVPAFLTIALMPFTYNIAYGLIGGILSYIVLNTGVWIVEKATGNRLKPKDKELKEFWTHKAHQGGLLPLWLQRAARGKKDFWRPDEEALDSSPSTTIVGKEPHVQSGEVSRDYSGQTSEEIQRAQHEKS